MPRPTYCSGYWSIPGNPKRSVSHYEAGLSETLALLRGSTLHFNSNHSETLASVTRLAKLNDIHLELEDVAIEELPGWGISKTLVECCSAMKLDVMTRPASLKVSEKGVVHYWRDFKDGGPDTYRRLLAIWMSKIALTTSVSRGAAGDDIFAWVDISLSRFNGQRTNWDISNLALDSNKVSHFASQMQFQGQTLPLNASFLAAGARTWAALEASFALATQQAVQMPYAHDEETILSDCVRRAPDDFHTIGSPLTPDNTSPQFNRWTGRILNRIKRR